MNDQSSLPAAVIPPDERTEKLNTKAAGVIGLAVMCSRLLGLARDQIFAALFGGGGAMDAFTAAFRIPNLLRDLFAEGALSTAFVTTFSKTIARGGDDAAWRLANKVATLTALVLGLLCIAGVIFSPQLVALLAPGFGPDKAALTVQLTRIMFPVHPTGVARGPGDGDAQFQERLRHAGHGIELLQHRIHRRRRRSRLLDRPALRAARAGGLAVATVFGGALQLRRPAALAGAARLPFPS